MGKTMSSSSILISIIITLLIMIICCQSKNNVTFDCVPGEKKALMKFKASFSYDPSHRLSSWKANTECCSWAGVECDNATGRVVGLDLRNTVNDIDEYGRSYPSPDSMLISETIDSSRLELKYLSYLDLSGNNFNGIPMFLGSMKQLQYLNLSYVYFSGIVPQQLGNLSSLRTLDLKQGGNLVDGVRVDDVMWIGNLSSLEYLDMSGVYYRTTENVIKVLNMLPSLVDLRLSHTLLDDTNLPHTNCLNSTNLFTNIQHLDLSHNYFSGEYSSVCFLRNMTSLSFLDLSYNSLGKKADWISDLLLHKCHLKSLNLEFNGFYGDISGAFRNLSGCWGRNLESLNIEWNELNGHLPKDLGELKQLIELKVGDNMLSGPIPSSIGNLKALRSLDLSSNQLGGEIPMSLVQLSNLQKIDISYNKLLGHIPSSIGDLKALRSFDLSHNRMGGEIPVSLGQLSNLESINISVNGAFQGTLTEAHFIKLSRLEYLNIGYNYTLKFDVGDDWVPPFHQLIYLEMKNVQITSRQFPQWLQTQNSLQFLSLRNCSIRGTLPTWLGSLMKLTRLDLSNNHIEGPILELPSSLILLYLSDNMITNHLPSNIGHMLPLVYDLDLSRNFINRSIPGSLCQMKVLDTLDLSGNHLSGHLPDCKWGNLSLLLLSSNKLSGVIPNSIGGGDHCSLRWFQVDNNSLTGQIHFNLKNCPLLHVLDVGDNKLSGKLPEWIGNNLLDSLAVLRLRNNKFDGDIPSAYCQLAILQIMDLAHNQLTGYIPRCFGNLSGMISNAQGYINRSSGHSSISEVMKGVLLEYTGRTSGYLVNLDLSSNRLFGDIPSELTNLTGLKGLNFSHNHFIGQVPPRIGDLKSLESFDLSSNNLSGQIPGSLSKLTSLSHLNLSNNDLSGPIPTGPQLQTFNNPSSYDGNPRLCGDPLPKKCHTGNYNEITPLLQTWEVENDDGGMMIRDKIYMYAFITGGVATGFWGYFGVLIFKRNWRLALFRHVDTLIRKMLGRY